MCTQSHSVCKVHSFADNNHFFYSEGVVMNHVYIIIVCGSTFSCFGPQGQFLDNIFMLHMYLSKPVV